MKRTIKEFNNLAAYPRVLMRELVVTDFKLRYQGSVLGYAWSLLRPLLIFVILYTVFVKFLRVGSDVPHYPIYLLLGIVMWNFFNEMTAQSLSSIVARGDLIRKIKIPRWTIIISSSISAVINLVLNLIPVFVFMFLSHVDLNMGFLLFPLILLEVYLLSLGISLYLSASFVKYRDIRYIWEVIIQGAFYLTPILYPLNLITNHTFQKLIMINPMAQAIQDARYLIVTHDAKTTYSVFNHSLYMFTPFVLAVLIFIVGFVYFKNQSDSFAENI